MSRATFNRYPKAVEEYRKVKIRGESGEQVMPFTIEDKNHELQESNTELRKRLVQEKLEYKQRLAGARQEVYILNMALQARDKTIAEKDREIAELWRKISNLTRDSPGRFRVVESGKV